MSFQNPYVKVLTPRRLRHLGFTCEDPPTPRDDTRFVHCRGIEMRAVSCSPGCGFWGEKISPCVLEAGISFSSPAKPWHGLAASWHLNVGAEHSSECPPHRASSRPWVPPPLRSACRLGAPEGNSPLTDQAHLASVARGGFLPHPWGLVRCSRQPAHPGQVHGDRGTLGTRPQGPFLSEQGERRGT